jgi:hypothetical protein
MATNWAEFSDLAARAKPEAAESEVVYTCRLEHAADLSIMLYPCETHSQNQKQSSYEIGFHVFPVVLLPIVSRDLVRITSERDERC